MGTMNSEKDKIIELESTNDEQTIHLFYNEMVGLYMAYGLSAYYTTIVTDPQATYSDSMDMPVVILGKMEVLELRQSMTIVEHKSHRYYKFRLKNKIGRRWYQTWVSGIKKMTE